MRETCAILAWLLGACVVLGLLAGYAWGHSWYDWDCCADNDCKPVPAEDVAEIVGGWKYLPTGNEFKDPKRIRPSHDGNFHVCINPSNKQSLCIYIVSGT
jgi:hypothetical protein